MDVDSRERRCFLYQCSSRGEARKAPEGAHRLLCVLHGNGVRINARHLDEARVAQLGVVHDFAVLLGNAEDNVLEVLACYGLGGDNGLLVPQPDRDITEALTLDKGIVLHLVGQLVGTLCDNKSVCLGTVVEERLNLVRQFVTVRIEEGHLAQLAVGGSDISIRGQNFGGVLGLGSVTEQH